MEPRERMKRMIETLTELWNEFDLFTVDDSLKDQSNSCRENADAARGLMARTLIRMQIAARAIETNP